MRSFVVVVPPEGVTQMLQGLDAWRRAVVGVVLLECAVVAFKFPAGLRMAGPGVQLADAQGRQSFLEVDRFVSFAGAELQPVVADQLPRAPCSSTAVSIAAQAACAVKRRTAWAPMANRAWSSIRSTIQALEPSAKAT